MKRKRMDRDIWTSIVQKRYLQRETERGVEALLCLDHVDRPSLWDYPDGARAVCESGMQWLEWLPPRGDCLITAFYGQDGRVRVWYVDVIADHGLCPDGVVWFDDLYVDLIFRPDGHLKVDDLPELEAALEKGDIDRELYARALRVKDELIEWLYGDREGLQALCDGMRADLLRELEGKSGETA